METRHHPRKVVRADDGPVDVPRELPRQRRVVSLQGLADGLVEQGELAVGPDAGRLERRAATGPEDRADHFADVANERRFFPALRLQELLVPAPAPPFFARLLFGGCARRARLAGPLISVSIGRFEGVAFAAFSKRLIPFRSSVRCFLSAESSDVASLAKFRAR
jgi:hypothetical protein